MKWRSCALNRIKLIDALYDGMLAHAIEIEDESPSFRGCLLRTPAQCRANDLAVAVKKLKHRQSLLAGQLQLGSESIARRLSRWR